MHHLDDINDIKKLTGTVLIDDSYLRIIVVRDASSHPIHSRIAFKQLKWSQTEKYGEYNEYLTASCSYLEILYDLLPAVGSIVVSKSEFDLYVPVIEKLIDPYLDIQSKLRTIRSGFK